MVNLGSNLAQWRSMQQGGPHRGGVAPWVPSSLAEQLGRRNDHPYPLAVTSCNRPATRHLSSPILSSRANRAARCPASHAPARSAVAVACCRLAAVLFRLRLFAADLVHPRCSNSPLAAIYSLSKFIEYAAVIVLPKVKELKNWEAEFFIKDQLGHTLFDLTCKPLALRHGRAGASRLAVILPHAPARDLPPASMASSFRARAPAPASPCVAPAAAPARLAGGRSDVRAHRWKQQEDEVCPFSLSGLIILLYWRHEIWCGTPIMSNMSPSDVEETRARTAPPHGLYPGMRASAPLLPGAARPLDPGHRPVDPEELLLVVVHGEEGGAPAPSRIRPGHGEARISGEAGWRRLHGESRRRRSRDESQNGREKKEREKEKWGPHPPRSVNDNESPLGGLLGAASSNPIHAATGDAPLKLAPAPPENGWLPRRTIYPAQPGAVVVSSGLCDCFSDCGVCCMTCWFPCVNFSCTELKKRNFEPELGWDLNVQNGAGADMHPPAAQGMGR
ncbi:hypothetical protein HU200_030065 [Digitaria exilis]|uniref:Uncharacterized protein n=1 Tax=Digitaria exilis TaxID=1010633 RepID=A0A835BS92_9POAL|nr:hypothetical protein HU200_030065 [Digitaria exilis]